MASDNGKRRGFSRRRFIQGAAAAAAASGSMLSSAAREQEHDEEKHGRRPRPPSSGTGLDLDKDHAVLVAKNEVHFPAPRTVVGDKKF